MFPSLFPHVTEHCGLIWIGPVWTRWSYSNSKNKIIGPDSRASQTEMTTWYLFMSYPESTMMTRKRRMEMMIRTVKRTQRTRRTCRTWMTTSSHQKLERPMRQTREAMNKIRTRG